MNISSLTDDDLRILWAAMLAMVHEVHSAQDNLTEELWFKAEEVFNALDLEINMRTQL